MARWIRAALQCEGEITVRVVGATEGLELNYIGNYLLKGPSSTTNLAFDGGSATSKIYQNGNRTDLDRDGLFDGTDPG